METLIPRILSIKDQNIFLFGPRGTGKTTFLRQRFPHALWVDLLNPEMFRSLSARPERLMEMVRAQEAGTVIIIDEVQKLPDLLEVVHSLIEEKKKWQFIMTGSSARKIKRSAADLLGGRAISMTMHPFLASELGARFGLHDALSNGMLPVIFGSSDKEGALKSYVSLYLREEVQMEGLVRNIGFFSRFMEAISFSHGAVLNISNVARECEIERKVVEGYISVLEDLLIAHRIPIFTKRAQRATIAHPKFYYFDSGVFRAIRPAGPLDKPSEIDGAALEGLVAQQFIAWNGYTGNKNKLYYWRTRGGTEVDFVLYGPGMFMAVEVKNSAKVQSKDIDGLETFRSEYPESKTFLLYRGKDKLKMRNTFCVPVETFLRTGIGDML